MGFLKKVKKQRNYRKEYDNYHSSETQKKRRAARNKSRREAISNGIAKKGDGKDIHHKDRNPNNNSSNNKQLIPKSKNRSYSRKTKDRAKYGKRYA